MYNLVFRSNIDKWEFENSIKRTYGEKAFFDKDILFIEDKFEKYTLSVDINMDNLKVGDTVRHFKGNQYKIIGECIDANSGDPVFIYISLYEPYTVWCRPKKEFYDLVSVEENHLLHQPYRFIKL